MEGEACEAERERERHTPTHTETERPKERDEWLALQTGAKETAKAQADSRNYPSQFP